MPKEGGEVTTQKTKLEDLEERCEDLRDHLIGTRKVEDPDALREEISNLIKEACEERALLTGETLREVFCVSCSNRKECLGW